MADLVIGGNTYQNIEYVKIKRADGKIATFFESRNKSNQQLDTSVSYKRGLAWSMSASVESAIITASLKKVEE